jgi:hypothetical protein
MAVITPTRPKVKINAAARGTPAKFEATPENVVTVDRNGRGRLPFDTAHAMRNPNTPPRIADVRLILSDIP